MEKELFKGIFTLIGVTVGAGVIGLPYVVQKAGFLTGLVVIVLITLIMILVNLYLGEILLRTRVKHQLSGLAGLYLGKLGKHLMVVFNTLSIYGALVAYVIGAGLALKAIFGYNEFIFSIVFFIFLAIVVFFTLNIFEYVQNILNPLKLIALLLLCTFLLKFINLSNLNSFDAAKLLVPYGVTMFALTSFSIIPEINQEIKNKINLKKAIIYGGIITALIYILFVFVVVGSVSGNINQVATVSLTNFGGNISLFANLLALFAMTTAFVGLSFALKENFTLDYKFSNLMAWLMVIIIPLFLFLFKIGSFIFFLDVSGSFAIGIILFLILIMHSHAKKIGLKKPEYELKDNWFVKGSLYFLIILGMVYVAFTVI